MNTSDLAEKEGFEPSVGSPLRLISSQVHSTTLPLFRSYWIFKTKSLKTCLIRPSPCHLGIDRLVQFECRHTEESPQLCLWSE